MEGPLMRPWIIVLSSTIFALLAVAALAEPELSGSARSELWPALLPRLPTLAVAAFGIYALCALLMTTGALVTETLLVRLRLGRSGMYRATANRDWQTALGSIGWQRLAPGLIVEPGRPAAENETALIRGRFDAAAARSEIGRLHYLWLARGHFFSALIVLTALVGLGLAQEHGSVPLALGTIPTVSAILILAGLILLAILGRIALDVSAEPLIETISQLPTEHIEATFLRRTLEAIEAAHAAAATFENAPKPVLQLSERLETVIEEGQRALLDAIRRLLAVTEELGATMRWSVEVLNGATNAQSREVTELEQVSGIHGLTELQGAVEALTAVLERLTTIPDLAPAPSGGEQSTRSTVREPYLARELQQLLQEIGADR
jgi:hypothetical protein